MKRQILEMIMALLLLAAAYLLPIANNQREQVAVSAAARETPVTVLIDAGHGAMDSGKVGINGALEKEINLQISQKLQILLTNEGIHVVMSRETDAPLYQETDSNKKLTDMKARIQKMTDSQALIAVSVHQNSYSAEAVSGPQVFYYGGSVEGEKLAKAIQEAFDYAVGERNTRSIKSNKEYYLLVKSPIPTVICECGFLSNAREAELLITEEYQQRIAQSICNGIVQYLETTGL